jgi:hypothetical protein
LCRTGQHDGAPVAIKLQCVWQRDARTDAINIFSRAEYPVTGAEGMGESGRVILCRIADRTISSQITWRITQIAGDHAVSCFQSGSLELLP